MRKPVSTERFAENSTRSTLEVIKQKQGDDSLPEAIKDVKTANLIRATIRANVTHKTLNN